VFQLPTCQNCATKQNRQYRSELIKKLLIWSGVFAFMFMMMANDTKTHHPLIFSLLIAYTASGIPWGWSATSRITPNVFLILPLVGWLIYFGIKFYVSGMVGFFITPFKVYAAVRDLRLMQQQKTVFIAGQPVTLTVVK
jgi:hypothetical protein